MVPLPMNQYRQRIEQLNARRIPLVKSLFSKLASEFLSQTASREVISDIDELIHVSDPFEVDLGITFRSKDSARIEIGYNPHLYYTSAMLKRMSALANGNEDLVGFSSVVPFYRASITAGVEWGLKKDDKKISVLFEDLPRHMNDSSRKAILSSLIDIYSLPADEVVSLFDVPELDIIAADFDSVGIGGVRLFAPMSENFPFPSIEVARIYKEFRQVVESHQIDGNFIFYRKYEPKTGRLLAVKFYFTPDANVQPANAHALAEDLIASFGSTNHKNYSQLEYAAKVCNQVGLEFYPVCLSVAVAATSPYEHYLALYYAVGGIPYELIY